MLAPKTELILFLRPEFSWPQVSFPVSSSDQQFLTIYWTLGVICYRNFIQKKSHVHWISLSVGPFFLNKTFCLEFIIVIVGLVSCTLLNYHQKLHILLKKASFPPSIPAWNPTNTVWVYYFLKSPWDLTHQPLAPTPTQVKTKTQRKARLDQGSTIKLLPQM